LKAAAKTRLVPLTHEIAAKRGIPLDRPHVSRACYVGKRLVGMGGLYWRDGVCWLWLDGVDMRSTRPFTVFRTARDMIDRARALGEKQVIAIRDEAPCSEKLLRLLGFDRLPDHPDFNGAEVWRLSLQLQPSPQALPQ
jgi:hypothetical protein